MHFAQLFVLFLYICELKAQISCGKKKKENCNYMSEDVQ